jgi:hypothetical protein
MFVGISEDGLVENKIKNGNISDYTKALHWGHSPPEYSESSESGNSSHGISS